MRELNNAKRAEVLIGVHNGAVAEYGAYNEFGTAHIPERSFMRSTFDENSASISRDLSNRYNQVLSGSLSVYNALNMVGMKHSQQIVAKINSNIQPKNADSTIAAKGSSRTLIDTGRLKQSITHIVRLA